MATANSSLVLHHAWASSASRRARFVLEEKELPYEGIVVNLLAFEQHSPEYLKLNPNGWVPTLVHDGYPITESSVICEYLDELFPEKPLRPGNRGPSPGCGFGQNGSTRWFCVRSRLPTGIA